jgi:hypothetical protein
MARNSEALSRPTDAPRRSGATAVVCSTSTRVGSPSSSIAGRNDRAGADREVDHQPFALSARTLDDCRTNHARVAGVAALLVGKAHSLGERLVRAPQRMLPKDALDVLRLLQAEETSSIGATFERLLADPRAGDVTSEALAYLRTSFTGPNGVGLELAAEAIAGLADPETIRASARALTEDLLAAIE